MGTACGSPCAGGIERAIPCWAERDIKLRFTLRQAELFAFVCGSA